jgi:ABC-type Mn2+/Zn2+ transport system permease subunit
MLARSLAHMFVLAPLLGTASVIGGIVGSYYLDLPSGPAIVVLSGLIFLGTAVWRWRWQRSLAQASYSG